LPPAIQYARSFLKHQYGYGKGQIGLFGFSQAGWVVPAVAENNDDVGCIIGVGFAMKKQPILILLGEQDLRDEEETNVPILRRIWIRFQGASMGAY
jgi:dienelactone hydrolase